MSGIYEPAEDSFFFQEILENLKLKKDFSVLEMGGGSGILSKKILEKGINPKKLTLADINSDALKHLKKNFPNSSVLRSNLFNNLEGSFDIILFNPPYLPEDSREPKNSKIATTGGKKGSEIINRFLKQSKKHLKNNGKIFLLTSSLTKEIKFGNYKKRLLARKKIFFEELYIWKLSL
jgi:release factor glutamine methyltransferase